MINLTKQQTKVINNQSAVLLSSFNKKQTNSVDGNFSLVLSVISSLFCLSKLLVAEYTLYYLFNIKYYNKDKEYAPAIVLFRL